MQRLRSVNNFLLVLQDNPFWFNSTDYVEEDDRPKWWSAYSQCPLLNVESSTNQVTERYDRRRTFFFLKFGFRFD